MELGRDTVGNIPIDGRVRGDTRTRADLGTENIGQRGGSCDLPSEPDSLPHQRRIGPMGQVLRIDGRVIEGIVCGDVQPSLTVWMLKGELDRDRLAAAPTGPYGKQQQLDLTDTAQEDLLGVSAVKSLVTLDNTRVFAGNELRGRIIEVIENLLLERGSIVVGTDEIRGVGVAGCRVDKGEEGRRLSGGNVVSSTLTEHRAHGFCSRLIDNTRTLEGRVSICVIMRERDGIEALTM